MDLLTNTTIIAICGRKRAGKDTTASLISSFIPNTHTLAFATEVKERAAKAFCYGQIENTFPNSAETPKIISNYESILRKFSSETPIHEDSVIPEKELYRPFVVAFGQASKIMDGEDIWVKRWEKRIKNTPARPGHNVILIPDLRFQIEYDWLVARNAKVVKVVWPDDPSEIDDNPSEKEHLNFNCDYTVINRYSFSKLQNLFTDEFIPLIKEWIKE